jgi:hypothetical protein
MRPIRQLHLVTALATLFAGLMCLSAACADEQVRDLSSRLEYAFYAEDSRSLQADLRALVALELDATDDAVRTYQVDYGRWKLAQLLGERDATSAEQFAEACANSKIANNTDNALKAKRYALHAACLGMLEQLRPMRSVLYKRDRDTALSQALLLDSKLPQVQLVAIWLKSGNKIVPDLESLNRLIALYDATALATSGGDGVWGHAESCYLLGRSALTKNEILIARNALERALILAPDYQAAQRLLSNLTVK